MSKTRWGFAAGVGAEFALWSGWSVNTELLYMQFEKDNRKSYRPRQARAVNFDLPQFRLGQPRRPELSLGQALARPMPPVPAKGATICGPPRFNGFYIGGNVGGVAYTAERNDQDGYPIDNAGSPDRMAASPRRTGRL